MFVVVPIVRAIRHRNGNVRFLIVNPAYCALIVANASRFCPWYPAQTFFLSFYISHEYPFKPCPSFCFFSRKIVFLLKCSLFFFERICPRFCHIPWFYFEFWFLDFSIFHSDFIENCLFCKKSYLCFFKNNDFLC